MSCALWRIHESIHRNDENQLFALTNQPLVKDVAEKLNISVRSTKQFAVSIAPDHGQGDLNTFGDLEREFGSQCTKERSAVRGRAQSSQNHLPDNLAQRNGLGVVEETVERVEDGQMLERAVSTEVDTSTLDNDHKVNNGHVREIEASAQVEEMLPSITLGIGSHLQTPTRIANESQEMLDAPTKDQQSVLALAEDILSEASNEQGLGETNLVMNTQSQPSANNVWSRSFAQALTGQSSQKVLAGPNVDSPDRSENDGSSTKPALGPFNLSETPHIPAEVAEASEDSDEEVVVFQPKRFSAQKRPAQQSLRPTTPNLQNQPRQATQSPRPSSSKVHAVPKATTQASNPINTAGSSQSKSNSGPMPIIDPDAFGRGFAVNTNPHPLSGGTRGARPRHSPQPSLKNGIFDPSRPVSRPSSSHRQNRSSPAHLSPKASPQQAPRIPIDLSERDRDRSSISVPTVPDTPSQGPPPDLRTQMINAPVFQPASASKPLPEFASDVLSTQAPDGPSKQAPIGSGRPSSKVQQQSTPIAPQPSFKTPTGPFQPNSALVKPTIHHPFIGAPNQDADLVRNPRAAPIRFSNPQQTKLHPANSAFPPRPQSVTSNAQQAVKAANGAAQVPRQKAAATRTMKPTLFEPTLDHTRASQPDGFEPKKSAVPEVQYVLKSGSTREQARGKGKLWIG